MRIVRKLSVAALVAASALGIAYAAGKRDAAATVEPKPQAVKGKPRVRILATGGTIAGAQESQSDYGYKSATFKVQDLMQAVPSLNELATLSGEQIANIGSQDMNDEVWLKLARRVNEVLRSKDFDGVVITHGTDTMEETGFFLNLVVKSEKPVVLVGSMRPATAVSADGPGNLYNAVAVAADPKAAKRGVLVVMNDQIHAARNVEKMNTTSVETFGSPERGPQGLVHVGKIDWFEPMTKRHTERTEFNVQQLEKLPKVEILYAYANMSPELIAAVAEGGAKGVVIAGVGNGNMTEGARSALEKLAKNGVLVVRSSRVATGVVLRNNEIDDDKAGFVASGEFNPQKARVLAQLALTRTSDPKKVQEMFNTY